MITWLIVIFDTGIYQYQKGQTVKTYMRTKKILFKVCSVILFLFMLGFTSCEEPCWTCTNSTGDSISACSESAKDIWESLDYVCIQD